MEILGLINIPLWLVIVIALCLLLYIYGVRTHDVFIKMGMDGPKPWPLLGNMPEVMRKGFVESNEQWFRKYGRVFGIFEGNHPLIYAGDVDMLKDITVKEFNKFPNRRGLCVEKYLDPPSSEFMMFQKDDNWRHNRNTLTPTFNGGKLKRMMSCIVDAATTFTNNLKPVADSEDPIDIKLYTGAFTMDTIAASAFGIKLDTKTTPDEPFIREAKKFFDQKILSPVFILMFFFPFLLPLMRVFNIPFVAPSAVKFFTDVTNQALIERRANPGKYFDFLQLMINAENEAQSVSDGHSDKDKTGDAAEDTSNPYWRDKRKGQGLTDTEILAAAIMFFTVGYETTATSLVHAFFHLSHNQEAQNKLIAEIDEHYPDVSITPVDPVRLRPPELYRDEAGSARDEDRPREILPEIPNCDQQQNRLTDTEILAAAIMFFTVGYETTATSLVHAFFHLSHNQEAQNKLIAEIDEHYPDSKPPDYETIGTLQYLEMVVMETLRVNPPGGRVERICSEDTVVHGYKIPAGMGVALPIYMIHHDPGYWPDPETFDPERFTPENREKHHPLQWIPFGSGPRNCIGMRLALLEMKIALVKFFQKYRIATNSKTVPLKFGETALLSVQKGGVWLTVKHRQ